MPPRCPRARLLAFAPALLAASCGAPETPAGPHLVLQAAPNDAVSLFIGGHADDWQLFMGDVVAADYAAGARVIFVVTTAGDAGNPDPRFWRARESGAIAAAATLGPGQDASCERLVLEGHALAHCTLARTSSYFLRLPDGNGDNGAPAFGNQSLHRFSSGQPIAAVDLSARYERWDDLVATLAAIVAREREGTRPIILNAPDTAEANRKGDHPDHVLSARALTDATPGCACTRRWFIGYPVAKRPGNLVRSSHDLKDRAFRAYDSTVISSGFPSVRNSAVNSAYLWRTYFRVE